MAHSKGALSVSGTLIESELADGLTGAHNTLLLAPSFVGDEEGACIGLLSPETAAEQNVLLVSYTKAPDVQLRRWQAHSNQRPANLGIISVEDSTRSVAAASGGSDAMGPAGPVETVSNPNDLTGLGIRITEFLTRWDDDHQTVVCLDSLTALLQYVDLETAYEFLHIITGRLSAVGAKAHFHMDPGAHDDQTVESIVSLMDAVVEVNDDGHEIRTRNF
jgi:hypothetical protein